MRPRPVAVLVALLVAVPGCDLGENDRGRPLLGGSGEGRLDARPSEPSRAPLEPGRHELELGGTRALLFVPSSYEPSTPAPFGLLLHGAGGRAEGGFRIWIRFAERRGLVLLAPQSERDGTWDVIAGAFGTDVAAIDDALSWIFDRFRVDPDRLAVAGFSDGATYALSLGLTNGDLFTHVVALSPGFVATAERVGRPRVWVSHGLDDPVLPIDETARRIVTDLRDDGYPVRFVTFDGGHTLARPIARRSLRWFVRTA